MASNTYAAVGNREDLSDIITNIAPDETPLYSMLGRTKATATYHEWLEDTLGEPEDNARVEGFTFATVDGRPRIRMGNYTQIMERGVHVTGTQEVVLKHGVTSEIAHQMRKKIKELAFDCERALLNQDTQQPGNMNGVMPGSERRFGGLPYWIITNVIETGGAAQPLTFDLINNALEMTWMEGGKPNILLVSPRNKRVISTFTIGNVKHMPGNTTHKLSQYIDVLESDFGMLTIKTDRWMPNDIVYGLSPEYIKKAVLRPFKQNELPKISDMIRRNIYGEWTLEMRAEKAHFAIKNLDGIVPLN